MKIYESEIQDGLSDILSKKSSVACCAVAETYTPEEGSKLKKILADESAVAQNEDQIDLYYLKSILVSTGWNKNDDVFDPKELWSAKDTPEDKPFNFMHDEKDIIGHITGNTVVDFEGNEVNRDAGEVPDAFNILTASVIYTEWSDEDQRSRMQKIVSEIEDGKWFVSMECLFPDFDYALTAPDGAIKVVQRGEASAFLTKHLRSYGGSGKYENYRVGRLLRNLSFSGKGLVSNPANPRSVILEGNEFFDESKAEVLTISSTKEITMSDNNDKQILDLQRELAEAKTENEALRDKVTAEKEAEFQSKIETLEASVSAQAQEITAKEEENKTLAESVKTQEEAFASKSEEAKSMQEELAAMKKEKALMQRKAKLEDLGFESDEAVATVDELGSVDEETFDKIVAVMKRKAGMPPWMKKDKDKDKDEDKKEDKEAPAKADEETDSAEANVEVLEDAEESADVAIAEAVGEDDPAESLRAVASEWLGSILQSVPKENK
ncbi:MAG: hypothetical protein HN880_02135 [Proteobacteria bacterium]|jgi:hypothetical protein|nr:hypothetical protein [Pseudomonadota bacterium]